MKHSKLIVKGLMVYSIIILIWICISDDFYGLKFLSLYAFLTTWFFIWWISHIYVTTDNQDEINKIKKGHFILSIFVMLILPMSFGLNQKIAIIFFDIDKYSQELKEAEAIMKGSNGGKLNRFSGGALSTIMISKTDTFPVICNLLVKDKCQYDVKQNHKFFIKYNNGLTYPFKYYYLIFEIKGENLYRGVDYHVNLYNRNKLFAVFYLIFVVCISFFIMLLIPRLIFKEFNQSAK